MKYCQFCGHTIPDNAVKCPSCGKKTEQKTAPDYRPILKVILGVLVAVIVILLAVILYKNFTDNGRQNNAVGTDNNLTEKKIAGFADIFTAGEYYYEGYFRDSEGSYPVKIQFTIAGSGISDVIYTNCIFGGKIKMTGAPDGKALVFKGKDGNQDFLITVSPQNDSANTLEGTSTVGVKTLTVDLRRKR